jgi:hypothetical protein
MENQKVNKSFKALSHSLRSGVASYIYRHTAKNQYRKFETNISILGIEKSTTDT